MPDVVLRWRAAIDADAATDYKIQADKTTSGTFADVITRDSTTPFTPVTTTLNEVGGIAIDETTVSMTDATNFNNSDFITMGREMIQLGTKTGNNFNGCTRGVGSTLPSTHPNGTSIYKAHETYTDAAVSFGSRSAIRYHIIRIQGTNQSVVSEVLAVSPPIPDTTDMCTVWGIVQDITGDVQVSLAMTMTIASANDYLVGTSENIKSAVETTTTDNDGFFSFQVPRSASRAQNVVITISGGGKIWTLNTVPDQNFINVNRIS